MGMPVVFGELEKTAGTGFLNVNEISRAAT